MVNTYVKKRKRLNINPIRKLFCKYLLDLRSKDTRQDLHGKYSYLLFVKGENVEKGILEAEKLRKDFHENN